jgi:D-alanyl-D-alanine carboxypeptidase (penicillin-binding protein 5/6)
MYRRFLSLLLSMSLLIFSPVRVRAQDVPAESELYAKSAVLMDADSGRILYEKNGHEAMANASTTKILTCIVALENCDPASVVTVSKNAASQPKVHLGMHEGQQFYLRDLLYGLMLESYNDCAVAIAEFAAGDVQGFAALMNAKAEELGCEDSYFITPNGLDAKDDAGFHHTTAADLAKIMKYCIKESLKSDEFLEITRTAQYSFSDTEGKCTYQCTNHNAFLQMMEGALSGKTGFTGTAGYCYVGALQREDKTLIVTLLACGWPNNKTYKWSDTRKLMNYGLEQFKKIDLLQIEPDEAELAPIEVRDGQGGQIGETVYLKPVVRNYAGEESILAPLSSEVTLKYEIADQLYAPVKSGEYIGKIRYMLGEETLAERCVVAGETIGKIDYPWCLGQVLRLLWIE